MKNIVLILAISFLGLQGCVKEKEIPLLGEKGNGVTIKGIAIDYYTRKPVKASVTLLNVYSGIMQIVPTITELRRDSSNANGEFIFENVVFLGKPDEIVTDFGASTGKNPQGFSSGIVTVEYDGVVYNSFDIKEIFKMPKEVYVLNIVIG